ncbi:hypothetical protein [Lichenihabitans psoromatis]|uniref:hypothetical protein n=1 Tax=Lichenihabitans psoromatis TaxID=2528642 RepID=UPI001036E1F6|nr:hypothetical protein [Lichenihabitans psoromatis]
MRDGARVSDLSGKTVKLVLIASWAALLGGVLAPKPASAQFFWDQPRLSADDAAGSVIDKGFRPLAPPVRNEGVYLADVVDRRGRRERLVVSADNGEILQRFVMDDRRAFRRNIDPTIPRGPVPPAQIPSEDNQPNMFTRLFGGGNDDTNQQPPNASQGHELPVPAQPRPPRVKRAPRVVERTPEPARSSPIETSPLAAPDQQPAPATGSVSPAATSTPVVSAPAVSAPAASAPTVAAPAGDRPVRSIVTNPLSLPGTREQDDKSKGTATASSAARKPAGKDVPVAPLE